MKLLNNQLLLLSQVILNIVLPLRNLICIEGSESRNA